MTTRLIKMFLIAMALLVSGAASAQDDRQFINAILESTNSVWNEEFRSLGRDYKVPSLIYYQSNSVSTACGIGGPQFGPFYCPMDEKVYLHNGFFQLLEQKFDAPGDMAQAYVISHEIGHHVQKQLGIVAKINELKANNPGAENQIQVRMELHADCLAGMWARLARNNQSIVLQPGDIAEVLNAARQIGDDNLQRRSTGRIEPESFTHGTGAQRSRWFKKGAAYGKLSVCNEVFQSID